MILNLVIHNDWTMEGWINSYDVSGRQILDWRPGTSTNKNCPNIGLNSSSKIELYINNATAVSSRALSVGKWYHFAFVRSGASTKLYLDGLQEGATYADTKDYIADKLTIGASSLFWCNCSVLWLASWSKHSKRCCKIHIKYSNYIQPSFKNRNIKHKWFI